MLVGVVLGGFGEAPGRIALGEERDVVAGAQVPVAAVDDTDVQLGLAVVGDRGDEPAELPGDGVGLAADGAAVGGLRGRLRRRYALDEQPQRVRIAVTVLVGAAADNVVALHVLP